MRVKLGLNSRMKADQSLSNSRAKCNEAAPLINRNIPERDIRCGGNREDDSPEVTISLCMGSEEFTFSGRLVLLGD